MTSEVPAGWTMPGRGSNSVLPLPLPGGQTSLPTSFPLHGLFVSLLIGVTLCACTSAPENPSQEAVPGRDDSLDWDAFVALQIGEPEGTEEYVFGRISYIDVDQSRRIFVLDALEQKVRVFRPDGTFSFSVGRKGQGPGEFLSARGFGIDRLGSRPLSLGR